jgi:putative heme transporter
VEEWADSPAVREVPAPVQAPGRSSSLVSRTGPWRRVALTVLVVAAVAVIVVINRHTLARSLHVLAAASPGWLLLAVAAEAVSLLAFGLSRQGLLRANGDRVSLRSVLAITYAGNALALSAPFVGGELGVVYCFRQFRRIGLAAATTSWALTVSWMCSAGSLGLLVAAGAIAGAVDGHAATASAVGLAGAALYLLPVGGVLVGLRFDRARAALRAVLSRLARLSQRVIGKPEDGAAGVGRFLR